MVFLNYLSSLNLKLCRVLKIIYTLPCNEKPDINYLKSLKCKSNPEYGKDMAALYDFKECTCIGKLYRTTCNTGGIEG